MASDTTAALVLAHSWGDRRRRFIWVAPEGYENQAGMFAAAHESGGRRKGLLLLLRVRAAEVGPTRPRHPRARAAAIGGRPVAAACGGSGGS